MVEKYLQLMSDESAQSKKKQNESAWVFQQLIPTLPLSILLTISCTGERLLASKDPIVAIEVHCMQAELRGEQRSGSGHLQQEDGGGGDQARDEGVMGEEGVASEGGLLKRSASMWSAEEKDGFMDCFKVAAPSPPPLHLGIAFQIYSVFHFINRTPSPLKFCRIKGFHMRAQQLEAVFLAVNALPLVVERHCCEKNCGFHHTKD